VSVLRHIGPAASAAVPALVSLLHQPAGTGTSDLRESTLLALQAIGPGAGAAVPRLVQILSQRANSLQALLTLGAIGPQAEAAIPAVVSALSDPDLASEAASALGGIGPRPEVVRALVDALTRDIPEAAKTLWRFGPAARQAVPAIARLRGRGNHLACLADLALIGIEAGPATATALARDKCDGTQQALASCERIGAPCVPYLVELMRREGEWALPAIGALTDLGPGAAPARTALEATLRSSEELRAAAAGALLAIGGEPHGMVLTVANDNAVLRHANQGWAEIAEAWTGNLDCGANLPRTGGPENEERPPHFPWPPPRFSAHDVLPESFAGTGGVTLASIYARLAAALEAEGFEDNGTFAAPGGFALVTRLERIRADGSADPDRRFPAGGKEMPANPLDYLGRLFLGRRGEFRIIAFAVTTARDVELGSADLDEEAGAELSLRGGRVLPREIADMPFRGRTCHILIYHFARRRAAAAVLRPSDLSTRQHLRKAGLWQRLSPGP
jgi:hypothetical protein